MNSKIIHATFMGAAVIIIVAGVAIIERERNKIYIPREPRINAIAQREFYIDNILNRGYRHCVEQPIICVMFSQVMTYCDHLKICLLGSK